MKRLRRPGSNGVVGERDGKWWHMAHAAPNIPEAVFCNVIGLLEKHLSFVISAPVKKTGNMQCWIECGEMGTFICD